MDDQYPDNRMVDYWATKFLFDVAEELGISDTAELPSNAPPFPVAQNEKQKNLTDLRHAAIDAMVHQPIPLSVAKIIVERLIVAAKAS